MKKITLVITILFLGVSLSACQNQSKREGGKDSPLQLTIKTDKKVYRIGEPIWMDVSIKNVSEDVQSIESWTLPNWNIHTLIWEINGRKASFFFHIAGGRAKINLKPNEIFKWPKATINDLGYGHALITPGIYIITTRFSNYASNSLTIELKARKEKYLRHYKGLIDIPVKLYSTYKRFVKALYTGDKKKILQLCSGDLSLVTYFGSETNIFLMKKSFQKDIVNADTAGNNTWFQLITESHILLFVKSKDGNWELSSIREN